MKKKVYLKGALFVISISPVLIINYIDICVFHVANFRGPSVYVCNYILVQDGPCPIFSMCNPLIFLQSYNPFVYPFSLGQVYSGKYYCKI